MSIAVRYAVQFDWVYIDWQNQCKVLVKENKQLTKELKQLRKETAEKFVIAVKENSETEYIYGEKCHKHYSISEDDLNEICKYFAEGANG